ncbi:MAG: hypothetical protein WD425_15805 [Nitrospirales bacterium]
MSKFCQGLIGWAERDPSLLRKPESAKAWAGMKALCLERNLKTQSNFITL